MRSAGKAPMPRTLGPISERRTGGERRSGADRRTPAPGMDDLPASVPLERVFPHARLSEQESADRAVAIEAHRRELGSRLGRNVGAVGAAVDYLLNIS